MKKNLIKLLLATNDDFIPSNEIEKFESSQDCEIEESLEEISDSKLDDDCGNLLYTIPEVGVVHRNENREYYVDQDSKTAEDHLRCWDNGDRSYYEICSSFGLSTSPEPLDDSHKDECKIWVKYNYYAGNCGTPLDGYLEERFAIEDDYDTTLDPSSCDPAIFASFQDASDWIATREEGSYTLANGEYARCEYTICE